jgi:hypothetical protein
MTLTEAETANALTDWLQSRIPTRTTPKVVYFSHDPMTGLVTIETDAPIPNETDDDIGDDEEDRQWDDIALNELAFTPRAMGLFKFLDVGTVGEAYDKILSKGPTIALRTPNMGKKTLRHMAYIIRKAMSGLVIDGVYYAPAQQKFHDYLNTTYKLQPGIDDLSEERSDE